ncbi:four helix bundle protein [Candidatus Collierbacteria bacterium]|nr:four helix bundle protein [Candidatus Collierbacteria bacterium]
MINLHQSAQMTNSKQIRNIHDRVFSWVVSVLRLLDKIPYSPRNKIIVGQLTRAVTSTGANDQETDGASSTNDFIYKYELTKREAKESHYWLRIFRSIMPEIEVDSLIEEADQLIKIFSAIIKNTKNKKFTDKSL